VGGRVRDRVQGSKAGNVTAVPGPPGARPRSAAVQPGDGSAALQRSGACRATARNALDAALHGILLGGRDRQFLRRLVHWDKRNAAAVASLLWRARQAGRNESALSARQLEIVLTALEDAGVYRISGAAAAGCWDCQNIPGGRCADHARDADRARACAELAAQLAAGVTGPAAPAAGAAGELQRLTDLSGFRHRTSVAS
jgi:hypothetical protein